MCATGTQCSRSRRPPQGHSSLLLFRIEGWNRRCPGCQEKRGKHQRAKEQPSGPGSPRVRATLPSAAKLPALILPPSCSRGWGTCPFSPGSRRLVSVCPASGPAPFMRALEAGLRGPSSRRKLEGRGQAAVKVILPGRGIRVPSQR